MKSGLFWVLGGVIGLSAQAMAQTAPVCPVAADIHFVSFTPPPLIPITVFTPAFPVLMVARFFPSPSSVGPWDLRINNAAFSGNAITVDGNVVLVPSIGIPPPLQYFSLGNLAAGTYTVTVRPVFGSTSPVACPELVLPLVIHALPGSVPVPVGFAPLAVLAGLLASAGLWFSRRRYRLS